MSLEREPKAIFVPDFPRRARRKRIITKKDFNILLYVKKDVPYVKFHFTKRFWRPS